ncbi:hypothetical protein [Pedobacter caeni]|uniref:Uncharacterized protein n=1 Tax=Pedobacter caeni TaxID=288992 RepID=A0A1M4TSQ6_9SPHI|nr:hypothetical protein [Pedobacter caeni]SHE47483.1 hypothetical protein SAMN04488522_101305 [Pedobacter caeni]
MTTRITFNHFTLILTLFFWLYIPFKVINLYQSLVPRKGFIESVEKSGNRIPSYYFKLKNDNNTYVNNGNGTLSLFKQEPKPNLHCTFSTSPDEVNLSQIPTEIFYIGLNEQNKLIDCYYYVVRKGLFTHLTTILFSFILIVLNIIAYNRSKKKLYWYCFVICLLQFFLFMLL